MTIITIVFVNQEDLLNGLKKVHNVLDELVEYFHISEKLKAQEILSLLSEDDLKEIHDYLTINDHRKMKKYK